jgi:hypothetical protein
MTISSTRCAYVRLLCVCVCERESEREETRGGAVRREGKVNVCSNVIPGRTTDTVVLYREAEEGAAHHME